MNNKTLSVVLATRNEEANLPRLLDSVRGIADEIVIFDEQSTDRTVEIAKKAGAKVFSVEHNANFHITKKNAIEKASSDWILLMDADESVSIPLQNEIKRVISLSQEELNNYEIKDGKKRRLFSRHQKILGLNKEGDVVAFFLPRVNMFLGAPLIHGGVYPDGVVRLFKKGKGVQPADNVHEQIMVDGAIGWLENDLLHWDSPTLGRYFSRLNRYTDLNASSYAKQKLSKNILSILRYLILLPLKAFLLRYIRHKGFLDGFRGLLWALFSASHYPISYLKYIIKFK